MMKRFLYFLIIILILISTPVFAEISNQAMNPGFEEKDGSDPYYWATGSWEDKGKFSLDTAQSHSGTASVMITNDVATDSRYKQQIQIKENTYYKLSCWVKTENVGPDAKGANLSIDGILDTSADIRGTADWSYVEFYGVSGKDQQSFTFTLGLGGYGSLNTGKAWFDDVSVEELKSPPQGVNIYRMYAADTGTDVDKNSASSDSRKEKTGSAGFIFLSLMVAIIFIIAVVVFMPPKNKANINTNPQNPKKINTASCQLPPLLRMKLDKKDYIIMAVMTVIYLLFAVPNLGSLKAPQTYWTPSRQGESIVLDFGKDTSLGRIYYYAGFGYDRPGEGKYRLQYKDGSGQFVPLATIEKKSGDIFIWKYVAAPDIKARFLKIIVDSPTGTLNEIAFFERDSKTPLEGFKIVEKNTAAADEGQVENLFDEADTVDYNHTYFTDMIFDEIYHARTAYEYVNHMKIYEWTHPPLGKLLISIGIAIFGMVPFGWRIIGTLFGAAMIPIMYLFGRKLFDEKFYGFCAAFLMMFDFMHFGLTRIATIDVYGTFFVILMYYFMWDYFVNKSYVLGFRQSLKPLLLSGICFGLGAASKWIGLYAGGGLAVLFFSVKYSEYMEYRSLTRRNLKKVPWYNDFIPLYLWRTILYCVLFFVVIPAAIYAASYIPGIITGSYEGFGYILRNQTNMFNYHSRDVLNSTHPFSSDWWQWPMMLRPLETYAGSDLPSGMSSTMTIIGNPAIWWVGIFAVAAALCIAVKKRDRRMTVMFVAIAFQYLPWVGISRLTFIYHFFSSVPFIILSIVYIIKNLIEYYPKIKFVVYIYLGLVMILFILFYPVLSGMEVSRYYVEHYLLWLKGLWVF